VLKQGGRLVVSDIVLLEKLPEAVQQSVAAYIGCLAGATLKEQYLAAISSAGFRDLKVIEESGFGADYMSNDPVAKTVFNDAHLSRGDLIKLDRAVRSVKVSAVKP